MQLKTLLFIFFSCITPNVFSQISFVERFNSIVFAEGDMDITATPDGGWLLISDASGQLGELFPAYLVIIKYNACGEQAWSKRIAISDTSLFEEQLAVEENGDFWLMGVLSQSENRSAVLLKFNTEGNLLLAKKYDGFSRLFPYSLALRPNGDLMIYGNKETSSSSQNFILLLNPDGGIKWAKGYFENPIWGRAITTADNGFYCRSGDLIYKVAENGELQWARNIQGIHGSVEPVETGNGFANLKVQYGGSASSFVYFLDHDGNLNWSTLDLKLNGQGDLVALPEGGVFVTGTEVSALPGNFAALIRLDEAGNILQQRGFNPNPEEEFFDGIVAAMLHDSTIAFAGLHNFTRLFFAKTNTDYDFDCGTTPYEETDRRPELNISNTTTGVDDLLFESSELEVLLEAFPVESNRGCLVNETEFPDLPADTTFCIGESLLLNVFLEGASYLWQDGSTASSFEVNASGIYEVELSLCGDTIIRDITIEVEDCPCIISIPNAFTPDGDGANDEFSVLRNCEVEGFTLKIYNRWGELVYVTENPDDGWNGQTKKNEAPKDHYLYFTQYTFIEIGQVNEKQQRGDFTLIR